MNKKRYNIGLLVANVMDPFNNEVTKGVMTAAEEYDVNLTIFPVKYFDIDWATGDGMFEYQYNAMLSHAATGLFDYLIVCIGSIAYVCDDRRKKEILDVLQGTPVLSVSANVSGYDYIQYDNASGIEEAIDYLVGQGRKRICMMAGADTNYECVERVEAFRKALTAHNMECPDKCIVKCDLSEFCMDEARQLLDDNPDTDAVICVTDPIAVTLCKVIKSRNVRVGQDIAVVGFDDLPYAAKLDPPLSSIRADAYGLGYRSLQKALNHLNGVVDTDCYFDTKFIPRASCQYENVRMSDDDMFCGSYSEITRNIMMYIYENEDISDAKMSTKSFLDYAVSLIMERIVKGKASDSDISYICHLLENYFEGNKYDDDMLLRIVDIFEFACTWLSDANQDVKRVKAMDCVRKAVYRKLMGGLIADLNVANNGALEYAHNANLVTRESLMYSGDLKRSYANILTKLHCIGIKRSYLYRLAEPMVYRQGKFFSKNVEWRFEAYQEGVDTYVVPAEERDITSDNMYCNSYMGREKRHTHIVVDLFSREYQYGILLCEIESDEFFKSLEFVVYQMSSAVKIVGAMNQQELMLAELHAKNLALEKDSKIDVLTGIYNRRGFYDAAYALISKDENRGKELVVCYADMDNLKVVNDTYGHIEGDYSLKLLAECLTYVFGEHAIVGRMGGDEFAAVVVKEHIKSCECITQMKEKWLHDFNNQSSKPYTVDMSMGIHECVCNNSYDLKDAMDKADDILYTVKVRRKKHR